MNVILTAIVVILSYLLGVLYVLLGPSCFSRPVTLMHVLSLHSINLMKPITNIMLVENATIHVCTAQGQLSISVVNAARIMCVALFITEYLV